MKSMTTTPEVLNEASVNAVAGADIITLPYERDEKPKLIPPPAKQAYRDTAFYQRTNGKISLCEYLSQARHS